MERLLEIVGVEVVVKSVKRGTHSKSWRKIVLWTVP